MVYILNMLGSFPTYAKPNPSLLSVELMRWEGSRNFEAVGLNKKKKFNLLPEAIGKY